MNIVNTVNLRRFAALLLLGSASAHAAASENRANSTDIVKNVSGAEGSIQAASNITETASQPPASRCHFGMCIEAKFDAPENQTVIRSDVLPQLGLPSLDAEPNC